MIPKKSLPIFSLHAAGQAEPLKRFLEELKFDECRYIKQDARDFALVVFTKDGVYQGIVSCKNEDMKNFALRRGKDIINAR